MNLLKTCSVLAASVLLAAPVHAATTTVMNGSFETYDASQLNGNGWTVFNSIPGWTTTSGAGIEIQTNATLGSIDAQDGTSYVELDSHNNSSMVQSVYLTAGSYELSFYYSPRNNTVGDNGIDYSIAGLSGNISGPSTVAPISAVGAWTKVTGFFQIGAPANYDLSFAATGNNNSLGGFVDNVSISAVPLPAAGFLLLGALGGLGALRRRRRPTA